MSFEAIVGDGRRTMYIQRSQQLTMIQWLKWAKTVSSRANTCISLTSLKYVHFYACYCWWGQFWQRPQNAQLRISSTAAYEQHVNCLFNTWICAGKNMTVNSTWQGFLCNKKNDKIYVTVTFTAYSKTCVKQPLKNRQNKDLNDKW